jgi:hypothetical protein
MSSPIPRPSRSEQVEDFLRDLLEPFGACFVFFGFAALFALFVLFVEWVTGGFNR